LIGLNSCHSIIETDFANYKQKIVLNSTLETDSLISVQLTYTANLEDSIPSKISNATVIVCSDNILNDTLAYNGNGWYLSNKKAKPNVHYHCMAYVPGYEPVYAYTTIPDSTKIHQVKYTEIDGVSDEGEALSSFKVYFNNDSAKLLFWEIRMITVGEIDHYNFQTQEWNYEWRTVQNPILIETKNDSVFVTEASPLNFFANIYMPSGRYGIKFYINRSFEFENDHDYYIELRSVSESYYKYHKQLYLYNTAQYESLASTNQRYMLYSNVSNGLGIFSSFSSVRTKINIDQ
jgi:hypothetical protein